MKPAAKEPRVRQRERSAHGAAGGAETPLRPGEQQHDEMGSRGSGRLAPLRRHVRTPESLMAVP
jgi:hypothetical protein